MMSKSCSVDNEELRNTTSRSSMAALEFRRWSWIAGKGCSIVLMANDIAFKAWHSTAQDMNISSLRWQPEYLCTSGNVLCEAENLDVLLFPKLVGNGAKNSGTDWLSVLVDKHHSVVVKLHFAPITAAPWHCSTNNYTVVNLSFLHFPTWLRFLY
nr:hypothetical protein Iba_chr06fCG7210 [Ipomoea batatas]